MTIHSAVGKFNEDRGWQVAGLLIILLLALGLRLYGLDQWSFWGDEIITVERAEAILDLSLSRWTPSLLVTKGVFQLAGINEWSARAPSAFAGVITILVLFPVIAKIFEPFVAALSALFLAISPWHLYWSQNARFYVFLLLFFTLGLFFFYLGLERDRPWLMLLSGAFFGLAIVERQLGAFFLPIIGVYLLLVYLPWFERPQGLRWKNLFVFSLPLLPVALLVLSSFLGQVESGQWEQSFGWINTNPLWMLAGVVYYVGIPTILMGAAGAGYLLLGKKRVGLLLALAAGIPLVSIMIVSLFQYSANRYVFLSLGSWLVLAGVAANQILHAMPSGRRQVLTLGVLAILLLQPLSEDFLYYRYQNGNRDNWRAAFAFVERNMHDGDRVISGNPRLGRYYLDDDVSGMAYLEVNDLDEIAGRTWFVEDMTVAQKHPHVYSWLRQNARLVREFDVQVRARNFEMNVYYYEPDSMSARDQP